MSRSFDALPPVSVRARIGYVMSRSRMASTMIPRLIAAANISAPGRPSRGTRAKPLSSAPKAAPRELEKYRIASTSPERLRSRRRIPTLMSGNVIPSRRQGGMISRPAMAHFATTTEPPPPRAGKIES